MTSTFHIPAFISACVLLLFAALIHQGFAQTEKSCDACLKATKDWCIKDYTAQKAKYCFPKGATDGCLGGTAPSTCPAEPPTIPEVDCPACFAATATNRWCMTETVRTCVTAAAATAHCTGSGARTLAACPAVTTSLVASKLGQTDDTCTQCTDTKSWCIKAYTGAKFARFCSITATADSCLGGTTAAPGVCTDPAVAADFTSCAECKAHNDANVWCTKASNSLQVCIPASMATTACGDGYTKHVVCPEVAAIRAVTISPTTLGKHDDVCSTCVANKDKSWCIKDYGTATTKPNYCITTTMQATACLGGTVKKECPEDDRNAMEDVKTCAACIALGTTTKWCIKGAAGTAQVRACVPTDTAGCTGTAPIAAIAECDKLKDDEKKATVMKAKAVVTTPAPTNTTKPNSASTAGVSAAAVFAILGATMH